jgi:hypothetical protein
MRPYVVATEVYKQGRLTFILTPSRTIVKTALNQRFFLEPRMHYWQRRIRLINTMIQLGEIRNLNELAEWCGRGVEWVPTDYTFEPRQEETAC